MVSEELVKVKQNQNMSSPEQMKPTYEQCTRYQYYHVNVKLKDGRTLNGIITDVTPDQVAMLVSEDVDRNEGKDNTGERQYGYWRARRFQNVLLPLAGLATLALIPYYAPYPYYSYPYPYYY